ncbi:Inactive C-alpha-formylglycine-proteinrating enzyme 2 [Phytophthora boehmeriae]|uniref:Inactive C-alpha-formylglycine-proteinrating enzyme 2 n=1 Tax=Phytophthora boehmeriae TaxID=109152 RepID=A0A8T1X5Z7_9STRA|nr:Inactive C-alpha-formylglycine-proteinrating enzyme 2 [Phytophthora boehmeriae]
MYGVPKAFYNCSNPLVASPEGGVPTAFLSHNPMSWGYFFGYGHFPPVARAKFLEPRHMVQICARWSLDKIAELQTAFFNGAGYVVWENVWGIWNAMTERESEMAKRMFSILREFAYATTSEKWTPYYALQSGGVFSSAFPVEESGEWLYTIVNTVTDNKTLELPLTAEQTGDGVHVYDVYHGLELKTTVSTNGTSAPVVRVPLEPRGFGAILITKSEPNESITRFLSKMQAMTVKPLSDFSTTRNLLQQQLVGNESVDPTLRGSIHNSTDADATPKDDMVFVSGAENWWFNVSGVQIEPVSAWTPNSESYGTGVQFPWEHRPWNNHSTRLFVQDFWMDKHPVTNAQYATFLKESGYLPKSLDRFLLHWENRVTTTGTVLDLESWTIPAGLEQSPVVHVAREDAEAFAAFYGKRLPHDWEWQYVVSNGDHYDTFPWGPDMDSTRLPDIFRGKEPLPPLDPVGSHQSSRSTRFLAEDLVGYVWQMTDQFCDIHTCGLLLRGGSSYRPVAATHSDPNWYFPQALSAQQHNRFLMISEGYDRSAMVGFRCVKSATQ